MTCFDPLKRKEVPHWYALYTRPRFEKRVDARLRERGLESYLPLQTVRRRWSDRWKNVEFPLFSGYVFVRITLRQVWHAVQTDGVMRLVSFNGQPSPIPDYEIEAVRQVVSGNVPFDCVDYLAVGERVEVVSGPLRGVRGRLLERRGNRKLLVGIEQIRQALSVEVHEFEVRRLPEPEFKTILPKARVDPSLPL